MSYLFGSVKKSSEDEARDQEKNRVESAAAMVTMRELCAELLDPTKAVPAPAKPEHDEDGTDDDDMGDRAIIPAGKLEIPAESTLQRFLDGYNNDAHVAAKRLRRMLIWRASYSYGLNDTLVRDINTSTPGIDLQIETGKCYILNTRDKCRRPIVVVHVRRHDPSKQSRDDITCFGVHILERAEGLLQPWPCDADSLDRNKTAQDYSSDKLCIIFNLEGIGMANVDMGAAKRIIYMLTNFYPERMGLCLLVAAPLFFSAAWAVIRPWLSLKTQDKIKFCKTKELERYIDAEALPVFWPSGCDTTRYSPLDEPVERGI